MVNVCYMLKLAIPFNSIVQALNEHQSGGDDQEEKEEQPKEACCAYFHEVLELYEDEEPFILPKPYVPPIPFPGRYVKQKHDESLINVLGETVPHLECLEDDLLPFQEGKELKFNNETLLPTQTKEKDMVLHFIHKKRQKRHHNQVLVEIQRTIFKVPPKKPLLPTKLDGLERVVRGAFLGPNGKVGKKVHFGAIWSSFGHGMDNLHMEQGGWTNLKIKRG
ncbi:hypothetical protein D8674_030987 [Pyrus ussuriensis x Pyrus communis]|uniref:Uncharacterized protein n=1 Tax=Pyrus ussuriensis x Pyrus communis TaxID=2448454 RepID=A0A5N5EXU2_9ROSA|nr:hypothetical protein D8674_030987 [Pyrus ussuriensis x Pyrus communis]